MHKARGHRLRACGWLLAAPLYFVGFRNPRGLWVGVFPVIYRPGEAGALRVANFSRVRRGEAAPGGTEPAAATGGSGGRGPLRAGVCGAQTRPPIALPGFCELPASAWLYKEEAARQKRCSRLQSVWFFRGFGGSPGCSAQHASLCMSAVCGCRPPAGFSWSSGTRFG